MRELEVKVHQDLKTRAAVMMRFEVLFKAIENSLIVYLHYCRHMCKCIHSYMGSCRAIP